MHTLNPSCFDLFIGNKPLTFQNTVALMDFSQKMSFKKHSHIERHYRFKNILIRPN